MKILVLGATGMLGSRIAAEARRRGHEVTGVSRSGDTDAAADVSDAAAVAALATGKDAVVDATAPPRIVGLDPAGPAMELAHGIITGMRKAGVHRLVVVGTSGSLETAPGVRLADTPSFPEHYRPESLALDRVLDHLRANASDLEWTFICPPFVVEPGIRTGRYRLTGRRLPTGDAGVISTEDFAVAVIDEVETGVSVGHRVGVASS